MILSSSFLIYFYLLLSRDFFCQQKKQLSNECYFYIQDKFSIREISLLSHIAAGLHGLSEGNKNVVKKNYFYQSVQAILK